MGMGIGEDGERRRERSGVWSWGDGVIVGLGAWMVVLVIDRGMDL